MKVTFYNLLFIILLISPLINSIADTTINFFNRQENFFHLGLLRGLIILFLIVVFHVKYGIVKEKISLVIYIFLLYLFILTPTSSNFSYSFNSGFVKWLSSLLLFPLGVFFFRTKEKLNNLVTVAIWALIPIVLNLVLAQFFQVGKSAYIEDSFYYGGANIGITNSISILLLFFPLYYFNENKISRSKKAAIFFLVLLGLFLIVMIMKRAAIFGLGLGFIVYVLSSSQKSKQFRVIVVLSIIAFLSTPLYFDKLQERVDARTTERNEVDNEARYKEIFYVIQEFKEGSLGHKLFGSEPFNSRQFFGPKYFNKGRMIHGDLSSFFYGTGIVGLTLYLLIFITIAIQAFFYFRVFNKSKQERELIAVLLGILACGLFITATGSGTVGEKGIMYLCMGAITGVLRSSYLERVRVTIAARNLQQSSANK